MYGSKIEPYHEKHYQSICVALIMSALWMMRAWVRAFILIAKGAKSSGKVFKFFFFFDNKIFRHPP